LRTASGVPLNREVGHHPRYLTIRVTLAWVHTQIAHAKQGASKPAGISSTNVDVNAFGAVLAGARGKSPSQTSNSASQ
jgi:hypothetical protein